MKLRCMESFLSNVIDAAGSDLVRSWLLEELHAGPLLVTFTKQNGEKREMYCTLDKSFLPKTEKTVSTRTLNFDVLRVFDLEKDAWRSFHIEFVINVEAVQWQK